MWALNFSSCVHFSVQTDFVLFEFWMKVTGVLKAIKLSDGQERHELIYEILSDQVLP